MRLRIRSVKHEDFRGGVARFVDGISRSLPGVEVGFFPHTHDAARVPVAQVAAWNNEGTDRSPARPFWLRFLKAAPLEQRALLRKIAKKLVTGADIAAELALLSRDLVQDLKRIIHEWQVPANAPSTVLKKGRNDPLVDTRQMVNSVEAVIHE